MIAISSKPKRFPSTLSPAGLKSWLPAVLSKSNSKAPVNVVYRTLSSIVDKQHFSSLQPSMKPSTIPQYPKSMNSQMKEAIKTETYLHGPRSKHWWTGKQPIESSYFNGQPNVYPFLSLEKGKCTRDSIQKYFDNTWTITESLFACLQGEEAFHVAPLHNLRHPMIFYYGHPAALYVNKLRVAGLLSEPINPYFEVIFETGVDEMSWDDMSKNKMPWPKVEEVKHYRKQVYQAVTNLISQLTDEQCSTINQNSPLWSLVLSFEHEKIHIETSSVLITELPLKYVKFPENLLPAYYPYNKAEHVHHPVEGQDYPENKLIQMKSKRVTLGKPDDTPSFGWDNEYGSRTFQVPAFEASQYKVTNGEFYEFVLNGGYSKPEYWSQTGWKWRSFRNAKWPTFWQSVGPQGLHQYDLRAMFDVIPMQWSWPVVVNFHESEAFALWKTQKQNKLNGRDDAVYRVMSELEHHAIRDEKQISNDLVCDEKISKASMADAMGVNSNLSYTSLSPVDAFPANQHGFYDVFGNAWEWNIDYFAPLNNFKVHAYYEDFSTPCFDGLHHVIQGSSFMSTGNEASIYSRYHFRPHFLQHASFRLVKQSVDAELVTSDTDAPGPYVGNYPFRQSKAGLQKSFTDLSKATRGGHNSNNLMSKHFETFTIPQVNFLNPASADNYKASSGDSSGSLGVQVVKNGYQQVKDLVTSTYSKYYPDSRMALANVIDVGCGVGGLTFRMGSEARYVLGIDHDSHSISKAQTIAATKTIEYQLNTFSADHKQSIQFSLDHLIVPTDKSSHSGSDSHSAMIEFRCADPMCLPAELHAFDIVILNDVIDKVSSPNSVLGRLGGARGLVKTGGVVFVMSAFQWDENKTPKDLWLNNGKQSVSKVEPSTSSSLEAVNELKLRLNGDFEFLYSKDVTMVWRESVADIQGRVLTIAAFVRK